jgi:hypothetical protein
MIAWRKKKAKTPVAVSDDATIRDMVSGSG